MQEIIKLKIETEKIRERLIHLIYNSKFGHTGGDLSALNVLSTLYLHQMNIDSQNPEMENRDRFILSKGHCIEAYYCVLEATGFISKELVDTYNHLKSPLAGHPSNKIPGIEISGGSLGHGLSIGVGVSLAAKINIKKYKTYVLMGDGELGEGSIYEAAMSASHYKLDNLVGIIDRNNLQISGNTEAVMALEPLRERWESLGWEILEMNGDEISSIVDTLGKLNFTNQKPTMLISKTTKGKGVSYMENKVGWHHGVPTEEQYKLALNEIQQRIEELKLQLN